MRLRDPLSNVTRNERKLLLAVSAIGLIVRHAGLVPTKIAALEFRSNFFPWDQFHCACVDLGQASLDLFRPGCFNVWLGNRVKRLDEQTS